MAFKLDRVDKELMLLKQMKDNFKFGYRQSTLGMIIYVRKLFIIIQIELHIYTKQESNKDKYHFDI